MGLADFAQATFWGAVVIFSLLAYYYLFGAADKSFSKGLGALIFLAIIVIVGIKLKGGGSV